ncbi:DMT family transporter [Litorimonas sp. RW-G-Af-16]|uniref:DMT family transporter n=1 Tax=Litorimonas sp. RW-G-Af-16 TaxID=3241168 RepID=UPI00390C9FDA
MKSSNLLGYAMALIGASFFSLKAVLVKLAYLPSEGANVVLAQNELEPITLLALRMGFSVPAYILIGFWAWRKLADKPSFLPVVQAFALGILGYYLCALLDFTGLLYITAQLERILLFTYPIFVVIIGTMFFGGKITRWSVLAILLAYAGIGVIFAGGEIATGANVMLGSVLIIFTAFLFAMFQLFAKGLINQMGSWVFTCTAMTGAAVSILLHFTISASMGEGVAASLDLPPRVIFIGAAIAFFSTIIPSFLVNIAIDKIGSQTTAVLAMIGPITTIIAAIILLGEPFGWVDALGTAITISGIALYTFFERRSQPIRAIPLKT